MPAVESGYNEQGQPVTVTFRPNGEIVTETSTPEGVVLEVERADGTTETQEPDASVGAGSAFADAVRQAEEQGSVSPEQADELVEDVKENTTTAATAKVAEVVEIGNALKWVMIVALLAILGIIVVLNM